MEKIIEFLESKFENIIKTHDFATWADDKGSMWILSKNSYGIFVISRDGKKILIGNTPDFIIKELAKV